MLESLCDFVLGICLGFLIFVLLFAINEEISQCDCENKNCIVINNIQYCES